MKLKWRQMGERLTSTYCEREKSSALKWNLTYSIQPLIVAWIFFCIKNNFCCFLKNVFGLVFR